MKKILTMPLSIAYDIIENKRQPALHPASVLARGNAKIVSRYVYELYPDIDEGHDFFWNCIIDHRDECIFVTLLTPHTISEFTCKNDGSVHYYLYQRGLENTHFEEDRPLTANEIQRHIKRKRLPRNT